MTPATSLLRERDVDERQPILIRLLIGVGLPLAGAATVAGTFLDKAILICAGWLGVFVLTLLFMQPVIGIALMTGAFLMAAYPTTLQTLGALTVNNLLGACLLLLLIFQIVEHRDFSFLKNKQLRVLAIIGLILAFGEFHSDWLFPMLGQTVGKTNRSPTR